MRAKTTVKTTAIALAASVAIAMPAAFAVSDRRQPSTSDGRASSAARSRTARFCWAVLSHVKPRARAWAFSPVERSATSWPGALRLSERL